MLTFVRFWTASLRQAAIFSKTFLQPQIRSESWDHEGYTRPASHSLCLSHQEEEEWGRSFQSGVGSTSSLCTEEEEEEEETR